MTLVEAAMQAITLHRETGGRLPEVVVMHPADLHTGDVEALYTQTFGRVMILADVRCPRNAVHVGELADFSSRAPRPLPRADVALAKSELPSDDAGRAELLVQLASAFAETSTDERFAIVRDLFSAELAGSTDERRARALCAALGGFPPESTEPFARVTGELLKIIYGADFIVAAPAENIEKTEDAIDVAGRSPDGYMPLPPTFAARLAVVDAMLNPRILTENGMVRGEPIITIDQAATILDLPELPDTTNEESIRRST